MRITVLLFAVAGTAALCLFGKGNNEPPVQSKHIAFQEEGSIYRNDNIESSSSTTRSVAMHNAQSSPDQAKRLLEKTEQFVVKEGALQYQTPTLVTPTATELLYLDSAVVQAYNDVYPDEDFHAEVAQVTDMEHDRRYLRMLPGTNWGAAIRVGGRCTFCPNRRLQSADHAPGSNPLGGLLAELFSSGRRRRKLTNDAALADGIRDIITSGPFEIFHNVTGVEISLDYT